MPESHDAESHPYDERGHDHHDWPRKLACLVLGALEPHFLPGSGGDEWRTGLGAENAETPGGAETRDWADVAVSGVVVICKVSNSKEASEVPSDGCGGFDRETHPRLHSAIIYFAPSANLGTRGIGLLLDLEVSAKLGRLQLAAGMGVRAWCGLRMNPSVKSRHYHRKPTSVEHGPSQYMPRRGRDTNSQPICRPRSPRPALRPSSVLLSSWLRPTGKYDAQREHCWLRRKTIE